MFAWARVVARYPSRKRQRLRDFDYSSPGFYFVTICTARRKTHLVGALAALVRDEMLALSIRFPGAGLDEHVVMPDHVHFILQLNGATVPLPRIIQAFKSLSTRRAVFLSGISGNRLWQRGYYDRVIRNDEELLALRQYIQNNPLAVETGRTSDTGRERDAGLHNRHRSPDERRGRPWSARLPRASRALVDPSR